MTDWQSHLEVYSIVANVPKIPLPSMFKNKKRDFTRDFQHARKNGPSNYESGVMTEKNQSSINILCYLSGL